MTLLDNKMTRVLLQEMAFSPISDYQLVFNQVFFKPVKYIQEYIAKQ